MDELERRPPGVTLKAAISKWLLTAVMTLTNKTLTNPRIDGYLLDSAGANMLQLAATASAVNHFHMANATGASLTFKVVGTGNNLSMNLQSKGSSGVVRFTDGNSAVVFQSRAAVASSVNYVTVGAAATGNAPLLAPDGSDANANIDIRGKGTGVPVSNGNPFGIKVAVVPGTASATGVPGQWAVDANFVYFCTAANTWVRAAVATW